ncbi:GntR family transcriptional regulator [Bosea sp. TWI1241]|uniref:GntR family transcriptional regulator n=1 Tax=Bosea sp. TWI1241 TaxID=3148904 RepID=UPI0032095C79
MDDRAARGEGEGEARPARSVDAVYLRLKQQILDNRYAPGAQALESEIAAALGASRTPVREAFVRLQQEGLLEIVPRHGVRIAALSPDDMKEIYEVLMSLEPTAVELLAARRPSAADLACLVEACDAMEAALAGPAPDLAAWAAADERFHINLARLCGNRRLAAMIMTVWDQAHRARMFTLSLRPLPLRSTAEHRAVLDAILGGDGETARDLYVAHRRRGGAELTAIIERHGIQRL